MIWNILIILALILIIPIFPLGLPAYKISVINKLSRKKILIINTVVLIILLFPFLVNKVLINYLPLFITEFLMKYLTFSLDIMLLIYIVFSVSIEINYWILKKIKYLKTFDQIIINTFIITGIVLLIFHFDKIRILMLTKEIGVKMQEIGFLSQGIVANIIAIIMQTISANKVLTLFNLVLMFIFFIYFIVDNKKYITWKINYIWIIPYVVTCFINVFYKDSPRYIMTINQMAKSIFVWYGVKSLYGMIFTTYKTSKLCHFFSILVGFIIPNLAFLIGSIECFEIDKYLKKRIDGGNE